MNKPNQKNAITKAGHNVETRADAEVELPPVSPPINCDEVDDAFPRAEPTFGSLPGF
jgi:hypothetical protein